VISESLYKNRNNSGFGFQINRQSLLRTVLCGNVVFMLILGPAPHWYIDIDSEYDPNPTSVTYETTAGQQILPCSSKVLSVRQFKT